MTLLAAESFALNPADTAPFIRFQDASGLARHPAQSPAGRNTGRPQTRVSTIISPFRDGGSSIIFNDFFTYIHLVFPMHSAVSRRRLPPRTARDGAVNSGE
jgi:hypothetical protein